MEQKKIYTIVSALLIILFIAACAPPLSLPNQEPQLTQTLPPPLIETVAGTETQTGVAPAGTLPVDGQTLCTNTYYPVRQGATWLYKSSGGPAGEYSFTDTITAVRADGFTLSTQIGELNRAQDWTCGAEGLVALQLGGAPAAMLNSQGIQVALNATNSSGVIFPSQINPGDTWQHNLDFIGNVSVANEEAEATGNAQMNFTAIGSESVTVPAGTFEAMKIEIDTTLNIEASYEGITLPVAFSSSHTYWFAPGVGWVRATGTGNVLSTSFSETTELQSYSIP
ncbi:MAG TPA: hypothetical protein VK897_13335 [Anaerolineales bacterium]|nr:hypothetical protein [Anaerolineales bacterium]